MPAKKSKAVKPPSPPPLAPGEPANAVELAVPGKLATAQAIENTINLKKSAVYRLGRQGRIGLYKTGKRGGLRYLVEEVLAAIRVAPKEQADGKAATGKKG